MSVPAHVRYVIAFRSAASFDLANSMPLPAKQYSPPPLVTSDSASASCLRRGAKRLSRARRARDMRSAWQCSSRRARTWMRRLRCAAAPPLALAWVFSVADVLDCHSGRFLCDCLGSVTASAKRALHRHLVRSATHADAVVDSCETLGCHSKKRFEWFLSAMPCRKAARRSWRPFSTGA